jgi:predicted nuclease of predicted toxin-antitoxin system
MRFLVDECTGPAVAAWLRSQNHEVFSVYDEARGLDDDDVIHKAFVENWILITNDKDFGEKVYREYHPHHGVVFMRLENERTIMKIKTLNQLLENYADRLTDNFIVVTETKVRFARA